MASAILAEVSPLWGWSSDSALESFEMETGEQVDDLRVISSTGSSAYIQAKLKLSLGTAPSSDFGSAIAAFVLQYLGGSPEAATFGSEDRLVLAVGADSSGRIRGDLRRILEKSRGLQQDRQLASIAGSETEQQVLEAFLGHVRPVWREQTGVEPCESDLREFASKVWVSVFDLSDDGADSRFAQERLRSTVLMDPSQDGQVWSVLISLVAGFAAIQSGADRQRLQELLAVKAIRLRAAPSYRDDIQRLRDYSTSTVLRLRPLSRISSPGGSEEIKLQRPVPTAIVAATTAGPLLITGDPGAGKSASVFELISALESAGRDVLALAADALDVSSLGQLRDELGLEHQVVDVLRNWPGAGPGLLVVDGLDAARGEGTQDALLDLIAATAVTSSRWNVVASVRRFDLRYNRKLKELFPLDHTATVPEEFTSAEFDTIRHLLVPDLSDEELAQLAELAPPLDAALDGAPEDLRDLARIPFNLRLLAELVRLDIDQSELEPIATQVQLLDKYWEHRVIGPDRQGDARAALVHKVVGEMVANRRLQANRRLVASAESAAALNRLLSEHVLAEQQSATGQVEREILTFSHHVLFDYAVERSLLRGTDDARAEAILADPDLLLFARPSFDLHFRHLWEFDPNRRRFWEACLELARAVEVPRIGRIIAPVVAAELVRDTAELQPLLGELGVSERERSSGAEETLRHLVGAAIGADPKSYLRSPAQRSAWAGFAAALAECDLRPSVAFSLRQLVWSLSDDVAALDRAQRADLGRAARRLLTYALDQPKSDRALTWPGIDAVAATYETDRSLSRALLSRILQTERLEQFGYLEMPDLAQQVERLIDQDPGFVRDVYAVAFSFEETSNEKTDMGGLVLRLGSHRSQDYSGAHYSLAEAFPAFLEQAPTEALEALIAVRAAYGRKRFSESASHSVPFSWAEGREAWILADGSSVWDQEPLGHDDEVSILNSFEARLDALAEQDATALADVIDLLSRLEVPASIWRRVLLAASRQPESFAPLIRPLLVAPEALGDRALIVPLGQFMSAGFAGLDPDLRAEIERAVLNLPGRYAAANPDLGEHGVERGERMRDQLLGCITPGDIVDPEIKAHLEALIESEAVPANLESGVITEWGTSEYGEREFLAEAGVDVDSEPNRRIQALIEPVRKFAQEHLNGSPPEDQVAAVIAALSELWSALLTAASDGVEERQADQAFGYAAETAEAISRSALQGRGPSLDLALEILLAAAEHRDPVHDPDRDAHFDEHPSWGSPAPRIEAAAGLVALASDAEYASPSLLGVVERLSEDPVPAVRFQLARRLRLLRSTAPQLMWRIADRIAAQEPSRAVTDAMLIALPGITREDPGRRRRVAESLYSRTPEEGPGSAHLRATCVAILGDLHVWEGDEEAGRFIRRELLGDLGKAGEAARQLIVRLRDAQTYGSDGDEEASEIRARAIGLIDDTLREALEEYEEMRERLEGLESPDEEDPDLKRGRNVAQIIDLIAAEVYFASGAFKRDKDEDPSVSPAQRARLYQEAGDLLDRLADVPLPPVTHHLLQTLEACIEAEPRSVFLRISRTIEGGKAGGYHFDGMAASLFVSLVERYLAEYRTLLQRDEEMRRRLIEMLDVFVDAGWPKARQLTYGLHELFR